MDTTQRTDPHRPSAIIPADYEFVAIWADNIGGGHTMGAGINLQVEFIQEQRRRCREHMEQTGGTYAHIETSGSCQVCGNVQAIYLAFYYHAKSNSYIRVGFDCSQKLDMSGSVDEFNLFRRNVQNHREAQAGKRKAIAILADQGLSEAWDIYTAEYPKHLETCKASGRNQFGDDNGVENPCSCELQQRVRQFDQFPERTTRDIVSKLVRYGSVSDKQTGFVRSLLQQIHDRPIIEAQRKAEADQAGPVPTGRVRMQGVVIMVKEYDKPQFHYHDSDTVTKILVKLENGSKVMGVRFSNVDKGEKVDFVATVEASKNDVKFGFFKRPMVPKSDEQITADKQAKKRAAADKKFITTVAWA